ncbi:YpjP family protein [Bacillus sp. CGMCC 1.16607]|uniref:YpjP family protein n=1 Tax=Bacillus sp. CGMCC 1.16607 TaxID=3351842 RepID=UPI00362FDFD4
MPKWLRKTFVVMITILTFGMVTPTQAAWLEELGQDPAQKRDIIESEPPKGDDQNIEAITEALSREQFIDEMLVQAENYAYQKFGNKIKPIIEDEFKEIILPEIEKVIEDVTLQFPEGKLQYLNISEFPTGGISERIFHIQNQLTGEDIIRFHVRRDNPPQEGYWFNFHYHTYIDGFQNHHTIGSIYWNKNMPPKWMS